MSDTLTTKQKEDRLRRRVRKLGFKLNKYGSHDDGRYQLTSIDNARQQPLDGLKITDLMLFVLINSHGHDVKLEWRNNVAMWNVEMTATSCEAA